MSVCPSVCNIGMTGCVLVWLACLVTSVVGDLVQSDFIPFDQPMDPKKSKLVLVLFEPKFGDTDLVRGFSDRIPNDTYVISGDGVAGSVFATYIFTILLTPDSVIYSTAVQAGCVPIVLIHVSPSFAAFSYWMDEAVWRVPRLDASAAISRLAKLVTNPTRQEEEFLALKMVGLRVQLNLSSYLHNPPITCQRDHPVSFFIAIVSRRGDGAIRETIRKTWLQAFYSTGVAVTHKFFVGTSPGESSIADEPDVVELPVRESYTNLGTKGRLLLRYIAEHFGNHTFFIRLDDDVYVRPGPIVAHIATQRQCGYWWGSFTHQGVPVREQSVRKDYISFSQFPFEGFYPMFARGFGYALSMDIVSAIARSGTAGLLRRTIPFDDVAVGYWIRQLVKESRLRVQVDDKHEAHFAMHSVCTHSDSDIPSITNQTWIVHHVNASQIECMWKIDTALGGTQDIRNMCACASNFGHSDWSDLT